MAGADKGAERGKAAMDWRKLVRDSFVGPREAARLLIGLDLQPGILLQAAAAISALSVVLGFLALELGPGDVDQVSAAIITTPFLGAIIQFGAIYLVALLTARIGGLFGGTGGFPASLALVVWLNAMMLMVQAVQIGLLLIIPPLAGMVALAAIVWVLWAFANFVTELHGFENPFFVLGGVILSMIVLFFGFAMILAVLGFAPQEPM